jgi:Amt family ammonium transporter
MNALSAFIVSFPWPVQLFATNATHAFVVATSYVKNKFGYDDSLDAFGIHGIGGTVGALLTGVFASVAINSAAADGLLRGNPKQLLNQLVAVIATWVFSAVMSLIIVKVVDLVVGLRVDADDEILGLDSTQHGESGYNLEA